MSTVFRPLFTAEVVHDYYGGPCADLEFVTPLATARALAALRLLARVRDGRLSILYEGGDGGTPRVEPSGTPLVFGLRLANSWFENFTAPITPAAAQSALFANLVDPTKLDAPRGVSLASGLYRYTPQTATRPLTVRLMNGASEVESHELATDDTAALLDLRARPDGPYTVREESGGGPVASGDIYASSELVGLGIWGILRVTVGATFAASPAAFTLEFHARSQSLSYYVVAENLNQNEFDQLGVSDAGSIEDGRAQVLFTKLLPAAFGPGDLSPALIASPPARLVMFRSQGPLPRRERGYRKFQLSRNGDVVVENLPLPRPDRPDSDLVVHVSKLI